MTPRILRTASIAAILLLSAFSANATMIYSINMEVRTSDYVVNGSEDVFADLLPQFYNNGTQVCDVSLAAVDNVGSVQTCGGPDRDIATLITITFSQDSETYWQFGPDWGRGGGAYREGEVVFTGDRWWNYDWNSSAVITVRTPGGGTLGFLGFEGCCGGGMSLRYSTDGRETWQIAAVNAVPEPGTLGLLGLGLLGIGFARRNKTI